MEASEDKEKVQKKSPKKETTKKKINHIAEEQVVVNPQVAYQENMLPEFQENILKEFVENPVEQNPQMMMFEVVDESGKLIKYSSVMSAEVPTVQSSAMQLALASEVEIPSPWVDISVLANNSVLPTAPVTSCAVALPTNVASYVHLPYNIVSNNAVLSNTYQEINGNVDIIDEILNDNQGSHDQDISINDLNDFLTNEYSEAAGNLNEFEFPISNRINENCQRALKEITADADICSCSNCRCDPLKGCVGGCGENRPCHSSTVPETTVPIVEKKSGGCCSNKNQAITARDLLADLNSLNQHNNCTCSSTADGIQSGCCVIVCLKTLENLRNVLQDRNNNGLLKCSSHHNNSVHNSFSQETPIM